MGTDLLLSDPLERLVFGGGYLEVDRGGLGMLGAVSVPVSGARAIPGPGWSAGLRFGADVRRPSRELGPGCGRRAGSRRFREICSFPSPGPRPLYPETLAGWAARVRAPGTRRRLGCSSRLSGFFRLWRACLPSSLPFCRLFAAGKTYAHSFLFRLRQG